MGGEGDTQISRLVARIGEQAHRMAAVLKQTGVAKEQQQCCRVELAAKAAR